MRANSEYSARIVRFAATMCLLIWAASGQGAELTGRVVGVIDGDTIDVLTAERQQVRVRLSGIDAPERGQPFNKVAKTRLSALVFGKEVVVDWHKRDRYGRLIGKVLVNGVDADLEMVKSGLAWHYVKYASEQSIVDQSAYAQAEAKARDQQQGLWRDKNPRAPWDFRRPRREKTVELVERLSGHCLSPLSPRRNDETLS